MISRKGMTLVEVIVAMLILTSVVLVLGGFSAKFAQASSQAHLVIGANEAASTRLDAVRQQPTYAALDSLQHLTPDSVISDFVKYYVKTQVVRIGGAVIDSVDYKIVTVTVTNPQMRKVVAKSTAVAVF
jgi:prepilin-type N-terminal cleavage/methylation domain-containing protein